MTGTYIYFYLFKFFMVHLGKCTNSMDQTREQKTIGIHGRVYGHPFMNHKNQPECRNPKTPDPSLE